MVLFRGWFVFHAQVLEQERHNVALLFDRLRGVARAVRGVHVDAEQDRIRAALACLQRSGIFVIVRRHHAIIVIGRGDQRRRILRSGFDVVDR